MKTERRRGVTFRIVLLVLGFVLFRVTIVSVAGAPDQIRSIHQFDFGTETSPVEKSTVRITGTDSYDKNVGYGWLSDGQQAFDRNEPIKELKHSGNRHRPDFLYNAHATDMTRDGVYSEQTIVFRVDLPCWEIPGQRLGWRSTYSTGIHGFGLQRANGCFWNKCQTHYWSQRP